VLAASVLYIYCTNRAKPRVEWVWQGQMSARVRHGINEIPRWNDVCLPSEASFEDRDNHRIACASFLYIQLLNKPTHFFVAYFILLFNSATNSACLLQRA